MKAMILAAGLGTRLTPFTNETPKPLLPILNRPQIHYVLELLMGAGVTEVMINLHHRGDMLRTAIGDYHRGRLRISYSMEERILGTGGGLKNAEGFFDEGPFILVNADALMEVDLARAIRAHISRGAAATMVVRAWDPAGGYGMVEVDAGGVIRRILGRGAGSGLTPVIFTGVHILGPAIFRYLPPGEFSCINRDGYAAMIESGERVCSFEASGYWRDVGTILSYFEANMDFLSGIMPSWCRRLIASAHAERPPGPPPGVQFADPVAIGKNCLLGTGSRIGPSVILGDGVRVGNNVRLKNTIALPGALFTDGEDFAEGIRSPRSSVSLTIPSPG
ncbi:MAG: NDP-sugar synthase [Candidatus Aureabacteria bacterium]|nr:NDP-sugar synthase [Candidatus Auribacterota bacterium]